MSDSIIAGMILQKKHRHPSSACPPKERRMGTPHRVWLCILLGLSLLLGGPPCARATVVGAGSCVTGVDACANNTGNIGTNACSGLEACELNRASVGNNACTGEEACSGNSGT